MSSQPVLSSLSLSCSHNWHSKYPSADSSPLPSPPTQFHTSTLAPQSLSPSCLSDASNRYSRFWFPPPISSTWLNTHVPSALSDLACSTAPPSSLTTEISTLPCYWSVISSDSQYARDYPCTVPLSASTDLVCIATLEYRSPRSASSLAGSECRSAALWFPTRPSLPLECGSSLAQSISIPSPPPVIAARVFLPRYGSDVLSISATRLACYSHWVDIHFAWL